MSATVNDQDNKLFSIPEVTDSPIQICSKRPPVIKLRSTKTSRIREKLCHEKMKTVPGPENNILEISKKLRRKHSLKKCMDMNSTIIPNSCLDSEVSKKQSLGKGEGDFISDKSKKHEHGKFSANEQEFERTHIIEQRISYLNEIKKRGGLITRCKKRITKLKNLNHIDSLAIIRLETELEKAKFIHRSRLESAIQKLSEAEKHFKTMVEKRKDIEESNMQLEYEIEDLENKIKLKYEEYILKKMEILEDIKNSQQSFTKIHYETLNVYNNALDLAKCLTNGHLSNAPYCVV